MKCQNPDWTFLSIPGTTQYVKEKQTMFKIPKSRPVDLGGWLWIFTCFYKHQKSWDWGTLSLNNWTNRQFFLGTMGLSMITKWKHSRTSIGPLFPAKYNEPLMIRIKNSLSYGLSSKKLWLGCADPFDDGFKKADFHLFVWRFLRCQVLSFFLSISRGQTSWSRW